MPRLSIGSKIEHPPNNNICPVVIFPCLNQVSESRLPLRNTDWSALLHSSKCHHIQLIPNPPVAALVYIYTYNATSFTHSAYRYTILVLEKDEMHTRKTKFELLKSLELEYICSLLHLHRN